MSGKYCQRIVFDGWNVDCAVFNETLASVAHGFADNLLSRAADVTLKERRRLVLMVREAPLNLAHIDNMRRVTEMGGIVFPPVPALYQKPESIEDMDYTQCLSCFGLVRYFSNRCAALAGLMFQTARK